MVNDQPMELNRSALHRCTVRAGCFQPNQAGRQQYKNQIHRIHSRLQAFKAVAEYYVPLDRTVGSRGYPAVKSEGLRLAARFDKPKQRQAEPVTCTIEAERIGSHGWGMMIAEVGLPRGADIDRRILDEAIKQ